MAKPIVDGLEADLSGRVDVLRLDLLSEIGREAAWRYGVRAIPSTLVIDGEGNAVLRVDGLPDAGALREAALRLLAP